MKTNQLFWLLIALLAVSCNKVPQEKPMQEVIDEAFETATQQYIQLAEKLAANDSLLPRSYADGQLVTSDSRWWCSGFFPGALWYLYEYSHNDEIQAYARQYTTRIEREKHTTNNHDVGFMLFCSFGNGWAAKAYNEPVYRELWRNRRPE